MKGGNTKKLWENPQYREKMRLAHLGQKAWNKGEKTGIVPKTAFKKGNKPTEKWFEKMHSLSGENSTSWKGEEAGYGAIHAWITKWKGSPDTCEKCGKSGFSTRQIHWANIDHKYRRVLDDFIRLCVKCHWEFDRENNGR